MDKRLSSTSNWKIGWLRLLFPEKCNVHAHEVVLLNQALDLVVNLEKSDLMYRRILRIYCKSELHVFFPTEQVERLSEGLSGFPTSRTFYCQQKAINHRHDCL